MKTEQTTVNKLIARFDNELKSILMKDLSIRNNRINLANGIQNTLNNRLKAA